MNHVISISYEHMLQRWNSMVKSRISNINLRLKFINKCYAYWKFYSYYKSDK